MKLASPGPKFNFRISLSLVAICIGITYAVPNKSIHPLLSPTKHPKDSTKSIESLKNDPHQSNFLSPLERNKRELRGDTKSSQGFADIRNFFPVEANDDINLFLKLLEKQPPPTNWQDDCDNDGCGDDSEVIDLLHGKQPGSQIKSSGRSRGGKGWTVKDTTPESIILHQHKMDKKSYDMSPGPFVPPNFSFMRRFLRYPPQLHVRNSLTKHRISAVPYIYLI